MIGMNGYVRMYSKGRRKSVYVFLGSEDSATNKGELKRLNVSRVLVVGSFLNEHFPEDFEYKVLKVQDSLEQDLMRFFDEAIEFIDKSDGQSRCLVHCAAGISRSSAITVACLLHHHPEWTVSEALAFARTKRPRVHPNSNFMRQLHTYQETIVARNAGTSRKDSS